MVLTLDIAKKTGYALEKGDTVEHGTFQLHINKFETNEMLATIAKAPDFGTIDVLVYESQGGNLNAHNNGVLKGAIFQKYYNDRIELVGVHPRTWQRIISRKMGLDKTPKDTKAMSVKFANFWYNLELTDKQHDQADALCILYWYNHFWKLQI